MLYVGIIFAVITIVVLIAAFVTNVNEEHFYAGIMFAFIFVTSIGAFIEYFAPSMTPMDVYQGKTTLEYKVIDGVKVDSTVVWKNKED